uniref:TsaA-like domain-containing protein n=1 Tax=Chromera velia CCMP2878 TaxID=1169474 RepID=A0A0G4HAZ6_9ALVE|eukprot:Cvel_25814.t1-p1 / transcript=Cvel_25814.t1 / gene=Cvel_25814 / organism=Chromera_velia_CCMP2878 / gene_product=Putative S-adenosylmethionine-dependent, putative / transcript_product=Putative S-adenosylmethionine-dependent, putative / location=Cvel_scaffold2976:6933-11353(+) / protein_length=498 / sequence_SO=supercontig / SO=protein_coding / is_pseudo=false
MLSVHTLLSLALVGGSVGTVLLLLAQNREREVDLEEARKALEAEKEKRETERVGRIRAEQLLRHRLAEKTAEEGFTFHPVGIFRSCYPQRRGTPRQGGVAPSARGFIDFSSHLNAEAITEGLFDFSHVWLLFVFHENTNVKAALSISQKETAGGRGKGKGGAQLFAGLKNKVEPPRVGGGFRVGVFATRTPHRPNAIGLSVARLIRQTRPSGLSGPFHLVLEGADLLDGTPILDLKPYLPPFDSLPVGKAHMPGWAAKSAEVPFLPVQFSEEATRKWESVRQQLTEQMEEFEGGGGAEGKKPKKKRDSGGMAIELYPFDTPDQIRKVIEETLSLDFRSVHQRERSQNGAPGKGKEKPKVAVPASSSSSSCIKGQSDPSGQSQAGREESTKVSRPSDKQKRPGGGGGGGEEDASLTEGIGAFDHAGMGALPVFEGECVVQGLRLLYRLWEQKHRGGELGDDFKGNEEMGTTQEDSGGNAASRASLCVEVFDLDIVSTDS